MNLLRCLLLSLCAAVMALVLFYLVISICLLGFIASGQLVPGQPMFAELSTPTMAELWPFQLGGALLLAGCLWLRAKLAIRPVNTAPH